jgi:acetylornithine deacetylase/succinyl-diaminopimelate desuccinylase-like protein
VARHFSKDKDAPTVVLNGHLDTVDVTEGWKTDPFKPVVKDDKMYGLGVGDMKSGLAIITDTFKKMSQEKHLNLVLTAVSDEEGNSLGSHNLIREGKVEGDICLIPEPTGEMIMLGCRGRFVVDITVHGKAAHGARPHLGVNAIEDAARVISHLSRIKPRKHELLGRGSLCVLKIHGGGETLSVPETCVIRVDRHVVPGETKELVMDDFKKILKSLDIMSELSFNWMERPTPFLEPYITKRSNLVKAFIFAHKEHINLDENIVYGESVGDYNLFGKVMPTVVCGPEGQDWHSPNEFVYLRSITRVRDLYLGYMRAIAKRHRSQ